MREDEVFKGGVASEGESEKWETSVRQALGWSSGTAVTSNEQSTGTQP